MKYTLTIATSPNFGNVHFKVDGFDYWTKSGWPIAGRDIKKLGFGSFTLCFYEEGEHTIEVVDTVVKGETVKIRDTFIKRGPEGHYKFTGWTGALSSKSKKVTVPVELKEGWAYAYPLLIANYTKEE